MSLLFCLSDTRPMCTRIAATSLNPLIGDSPADTLENLCTCLDGMGEAMSNQHKDPSLQFFMDSVSSALRFEAGQLQQEQD